MGLDFLVQRFLACDVKFVGVVGEDCTRVEDIIDEWVAGDGTDPTRFILTSSHPGESVANAIEFARNLASASDDEVQVVVLSA